MPSHQQVQHAASPALLDHQRDLDRLRAEGGLGDRHQSAAALQTLGQSLAPVAVIKLAAAYADFRVQQPAKRVRGAVGRGGHKLLEIPGDGVISHRLVLPAGTCGAGAPAPRLGKMAASLRLIPSKTELSKGLTT